MTGPRALNLGCGSDYREGYVNVDLNRTHKADIYEDVTWLKSVPDRSFDEAHAIDVLEHLPRAKASTAIREWNRVLVMGGQLKLRVPSVVHLVRLIAQSTSTDQQLLLLQGLYGTQHYTGDFHLNGFTDRTLTRQLVEAGFMLTTLSTLDDWLFEVLARKVGHVMPDPMLRIPSDEDFLDALYDRYLERPADDGGKSYYLDLLRDGIARESIMEGIAMSQEAMAARALGAPI